jgi:pimeloyl-ACP methyl ester carboxylesterase
MEKPIKIKLSRNKYLYGKLQGALTRPLFIMIHGLPGSMDEELYHKATDFFYNHGFSTFRLNLYGWQKNARQLMDCTLKTHAADLDTVVQHFRLKGVKRIFVAGHSFGGPTILLSKGQEFDAAVLWDPSYGISFTKKKYGLPGGKYIREVDGYLMKWGANVVIGRAMAEMVDAMPWDSLASRFQVPFKIILAGKGVLVKKARHYFTSARGERGLTVVPRATHYFNDAKGMQEQVFKTSEEWFRKF